MDITTSLGGLFSINLRAGVTSGSDLPLGPIQLVNPQGESDKARERNHLRFRPGWVSSSQGLDGAGRFALESNKERFRMSSEASSSKLQNLRLTNTVDKRKGEIARCRVCTEGSQCKIRACMAGLEIPGVQKIINRHSFTRIPSSGVPASALPALGQQRVLKTIEKQKDNSGSKYYNYHSFQRNSWETRRGLAVCPLLGSPALFSQYH